MTHLDSTSLRLASTLTLLTTVSGCALFLDSSSSSRKSPVCLFAPDDTAATACVASQRDVGDAIEHYYANESMFAGQYEMTVKRMRADAQTNGTWAVHVEYEYRALPTRTSADSHGVDRRIFHVERRGDQLIVTHMDGHQSAELGDDETDERSGVAHPPSLATGLRSLTAVEPEPKAEPAPAQLCHPQVATASFAERNAREAGLDPSDPGSAAAAERELVAICMTNNPGALDADDDEGYTPLHVAAGLGAVLTVELLLKLGASPDARAPDGMSPADYAISGGYEQIAAMLRDHGASQTFDWSEWKVLEEEVYVTSPGSRLRFTWAGVVTRLRTIDGQPPREDASNVEYEVQVTWVSSDSPYECFELRPFRAGELEDAPRRSLTVTEC